MFDYFDELIYCSDYLDYQDLEYIEKINSDDQCFKEVVERQIIWKSYNQRVYQLKANVNT